MEWEDRAARETLYVEILPGRRRVLRPEDTTETQQNTVTGDFLKGMSTPLILLTSLFILTATVSQNWDDDPT